MNFGKLYPIFFLLMIMLFWAGLNLGLIFAICLIFITVHELVNRTGHESKKSIIRRITLTTSILFIIILVVGGTLDVMQNIGRNEPSDILDQPGYHNNTITITEMTTFGPDFAKGYFIKGDDGRTYTINKNIYDNLNREYINSSNGHRVNIFYYNEEPIELTNRGTNMQYEVNNLTTDTGKLFK